MSPAFLTTFWTMRQRHAVVVSFVMTVINNNTTTFRFPRPSLLLAPPMSVLDSTHFVFAALVRF